MYFPPRGRRLVTPYQAPLERVRAAPDHPLSLGLKSLWLPGQSAGQNQLVNFAPDLSAKNLTLPISGASTPAHISTPNGIASVHTGVTGGGYYRSTTNNPAGSVGAGTVVTVAVLASVSGAQTAGTFPAYYSLSEATGHSFIAITTNGTGNSVQYEIGFGGTGTQALAAGTLTAGQYALVIATSRGSTNDHEILSLNLDTGVLTRATNATATLGNATALTYESVGGANYGSDNFLNGNVAAAWYWTRGFTSDQLAEFIAEPFANLVPLQARRRAGLVSSSPTGSGSVTALASASGAGAVADTGTGSFTSVASGSGSGTVTDAGTGSPSATASASASSSATVPVAGVGSISASAASSGTATVPIAGAGTAASLAQASGSASVLVSGSGSTVASASVTGSGNVATTGGAASADASATGSGVVADTGTGASSPFAGASGTGTTTLGGSAAVSVAASVVGSGSPIDSGAGEATAGAVSSGSGVLPVSGTGSGTAAAGAVGGSTGTLGSGSALAQAAASGTGTVSAQGSGSGVCLITLFGLADVALYGAGSAVCQVFGAGTFAQLAPSVFDVGNVAVLLADTRNAISPGDNRSLVIAVDSRLTPTPTDGRSATIPADSRAATLLGSV